MVSVYNINQELMITGISLYPLLILVTVISNDGHAALCGSTGRSRKSRLNLGGGALYYQPYIGIFVFLQFTLLFYSCKNFQNYSINQSYHILKLVRP